MTKEGSSERMSASVTAIGGESGGEDSLAIASL